jgi:hypothetical protein
VTKKRHLTLSRSNLHDLIAQFLIAVSAIPDNEDIDRIEFTSPLPFNSAPTQIPITVHTIRKDS